MKLEMITHFVAFIALCLVQVLLLNHINLFGCAISFIYVYFILMFRRGYPKWAILLWCFMLGLCLDLFTNTPGVAASSCTLLGLLQPYVLNLCLKRDSADDIKPCMATLGVWKYMGYAFILTLVYIILFFTTESFSFFNWQQWLLDIGGSTALTFLSIIVIDGFRRK